MRGWWAVLGVFRMFCGGLILSLDGNSGCIFEGLANCLKVYFGPGGFLGFRVFIHLSLGGYWCRK